MTSLPDDRDKRNALLDSARARPGPETRKQQSSKLRRVETAAATAAAVVGALFSTSGNVLIGAGTAIDENLLVDPSHRERTSRNADGDRDARPPDYDATKLVPWLRFDPPAGSPKPP